MKNHKVIVVNGYSRGGTNLLWNVLQSHPSVVSPLLETAPLLFQGRPRGRGWALRKLLASRASRSFPLDRIVQPLLDDRFYRFKMRTVGGGDNSERYEGIPYTAEQVEEAALCIKSTDKDIALCALFGAMWDETYFVGLMRNGYAICEAWMRRGKSARYTGKFYRWFGERMIEDHQRFGNYRIVKFEDFIRDPSGTSESLNAFASLDPLSLPKLRFKSKRVVGISGNHDTRFGNENAKYWFDRETVFELIDPSVSDNQIANLRSSDRHAFEVEALPILQHFDYA